eukprot:scaffold120330_cov36-Tisochrysis_lutea.AAC.1
MVRQAHRAGPSEYACSGSERREDGMEVGSRGASEREGRALRAGRDNVRGAGSEPLQEQKKEKGGKTTVRAIFLLGCSGVNYTDTSKKANRCRFGVGECRETPNRGTRVPVWRRAHRSHILWNFNHNYDMYSKPQTTDTDHRHWLLLLTVDCCLFF